MERTDFGDLFAWDAASIAHQSGAEARRSVDTTGAGMPCPGLRLYAAQHPLYQRRTFNAVSNREVEQALQADATSRRILAKRKVVSANDLVGVRLNLNVFKNHGLAVQTIHAGNPSGGHRHNRGFYGGEVLTYLKWVCLRDAFFNVHQASREKIASGLSAKHPMASIDGLYAPDDTPCADGVEVRFNPKIWHLFCDLSGRPVRWAERVFVYGHRAYATGTIEYYDERNAPPKTGTAPSAVVF